MTNEEMLPRMQPKRRLQQEIIQRKMGLFGHVCQVKDDRLIKTVMLGMSDGTRKWGRPKCQWLDDIQGWTDMSIVQLIPLVEGQKV